MKDNGIDLLIAVKFQGWEQFFNRLQGPVFCRLVRELWIHAKFSLFQVTSSIFGKKIVISEKLNAELIGNDGSRIRCEQMVEMESNLTEISKVIFVSGKHSRKIKDLHPKLKVWSRIPLDVFIIESQLILLTTSTVTNNTSFITLLLIRK